MEESLAAHQPYEKKTPCHCDERSWRRGACPLPIGGETDATRQKGAERGEREWGVKAAPRTGPSPSAGGVRFSEKRT